MNPDQVNGEADSSNGGVSDDISQNEEYQNQASQFIKNTSLDKMIEMAEIARMKKLSEPPKWVIPDEI